MATFSFEEAQAPASAKTFSFEEAASEEPRGATSAQLASPVADFLKSIPRGAVSGFWNAVNSITGEGMPSSSEALEPTSAPGRTAPAQTGEQFAQQFTPSLPKPQGTAGQYGATVGEFLGSPASYLGPGGIPAKAATAVTAALGSEAAGQATKGTTAEPFARVAGGLGGGLAPQTAVRAAEKAIVREPKPPTMEDIKLESEAGYATAAAYGVELHPVPIARLADDITFRLNQAQFRDYIQPQTYRAIQELGGPLTQQRAATLGDLDGVRKLLGRIAEANVTANPSEAAAAHRAIDMIDSHLSNLTPAHVVSNAQALPQMLQELENARGNWRAFRRSEEVGERSDRAGRQAASSGTGANVENTLRQQFKGILNSKRERAKYSSEEIELMDKIVEGTITGNIARGVGKLAPHGPVTLMSSLGTAAALGPHGLILPAVAEGGKILGEKMTARNVRLLDEIIRKSSPLGQQQAAARGPPPAPWNATLGMSPPEWTALRSATPAAAALSPGGQ